jgi:hypothetical protein
VKVAATGGFALVATSLALWGQFENTELHDRLIDREAAKDTIREACEDSMSQMARLVNSCTEWCEEK